MKFGAYTAVLHDRPITDALKTLRDLGLDSAEINSGGFLPAPHLPIDEIRASAGAREDYLGLFAAQGITLTRASNVAFLELEWTPAMHDQAEDRCHRIGQHDAVTAWYLLAADTIDETMAALIQRKRGIVAAVTDGRRLDGDGLVEAVVRELQASNGYAAEPGAIRYISSAPGLTIQRNRGIDSGRPQHQPFTVGKPPSN